MSDEVPLFPNLPRQVPLSVQIRCVQREISLRQKVYPRWVAQDRMSGEKASDEICAMQAVLKTLTELE